MSSIKELTKEQLQERQKLMEEEAQREAQEQQAKEKARIQQMADIRSQLQAFHKKEEEERIRLQKEEEEKVRLQKEEETSKAEKKKVEEKMVLLDPASRCSVCTKRGEDCWVDERYIQSVKAYIESGKEEDKPACARACLICRGAKLRCILPMKVQGEKRARSAKQATGNDEERVPKRKKGVDSTLVDLTWMLEEIQNSQFRQEAQLQSIMDYLDIPAPDGLEDVEGSAIV